MSRSCLIGNPFSSNQMYSPIGRGKLVKTKKYKIWIEKNLPLIKNNLSPVKKFPVIVNILILANTQWTNKHDPDNCLKPIMDLLVSAEILPDDNHKYVEQVSCRFLFCPGPSNDVTTRISYEEPADIIN
jgi:Holliday junction resolvase RusA-like endonuclease